MGIGTTLRLPAKKAVARNGVSRGDLEETEISEFFGKEYGPVQESPTSS